MLVEEIKSYSGFQIDWRQVETYLPAKSTGFYFELKNRAFNDSIILPVPSDPHLPPLAFTYNIVIEVSQPGSIEIDIVYLPLPVDLLK